jgi:hypothetical protein
MTTRRWMIAVAVVGLLMGGTAYTIRMGRLSDRYRRAASAFRTAEKAFRGPRSRNEVHRRAMAERFGRVAEKYERAARYPWLSVEPDPLVVRAVNGVR